MSPLNSTTLALLVTAAAAAAAAPAHADLITALSAPPTAVGNGTFAYTYNVQLTGGQLDATNGSTTNPVPLQFGTVYDFGTLGLTAGGAVNFSTTGILSTAFAFTFANTTTPAAMFTAPSDDPTKMNVRFSYDGSTNYVVAGQSTTLTPVTTLPDAAANLGTFTVFSTVGTTATTANYDGQTYKGSNNTIQGNVGLVGVPSVPEPASLALLAIGGVGLVARRRRA